MPRQTNCKVLNMGSFTTVLWDVDNTLLDFPYSQRCAITKCFHDIGREINEEIIERYSAINDSYWKRHERGEITKAQLLTGRFITLFEEYHIEDVDVEAFNASYMEEIGNHFRYLDYSPQICNGLCGKVKQYIVTNGNGEVQRKKLTNSRLLPIMDGMFISEEIGAPKPHKEFFDYCLAHIEEKDKSKILIIGDSLSSDIKGGIDAGIKTCWYRPEGTINASGLKPDYEISELRDVFNIIR